MFLQQSLVEKLQIYVSHTVICHATCKATNENSIILLTKLLANNLRRKKAGIDQYLKIELLLHKHPRM